jgi:hypothetical protein
MIADAAGYHLDQCASGLSAKSSPPVSRSYKISGTFSAKSHRLNRHHFYPKKVAIYSTEFAQPLCPAAV